MAKNRKFNGIMLLRAVVNYVALRRAASRFNETNLLSLKVTLHEGVEVISAAGILGLFKTHGLAFPHLHMGEIAYS